MMKLIKHFEFSMSIKIQCVECLGNFNPKQVWTSFKDDFQHGVHGPNYLFTTTYCINCGFWNVLKNEGLSIIPFYKISKHNNKIPNLLGTVLSLFNEIQYMANKEKWKTLIILSRILIMHIAVEKGAEKNKNFLEYINFFKEKKLINLPLYKATNKIRKTGNKLNHSVDLFKEENKEIIEEEGKLIFEIVKDVLTQIYKYEDSIL